MALTWVDSFDLYSATADLDDVYARGSSVDWVAGAGRFGGGAIRVSDDDSYLSRVITDGSFYNSITQFFSVHFKVDGFAAEQDNVFVIGGPGNVLAYEITTHATAKGFLFVRAGWSTSLPVTSFYVRAGVWNHLMGQHRQHSSSGTAHIWLNGQQVCNFLGNTGNTGHEATHLLLGGALSNDWYWDDLVMWDTNGSGPWSSAAGLTEKMVQSLLPVGAGGATDFAGVTTGDNWDAVSDLLGGDDDGSYVESANPGDQDLYTMANLSGDVRAVEAMHLRTRAKRTIMGGGGIRQLVQSGTAPEAGVEKLPPSEYTPVTTLYETDPDDAASWTQAKIDGIQTGFEAV